MKKGGIGGGNTVTGLVYEGKVDLASFLTKQPGYQVNGHDVFYQDKLVAHVFKKNDLYDFLKANGVDWTKVLSKKLLPDNAVFVIKNKTMFILEVKHQEVRGSVDEKLQTCDFKKKQYQRLLAQLNMNVEYIYILDNWFRKPKYKDVLDYIISVGCQYYFSNIPLSKLGLPEPHITL